MYSISIVIILVVVGGLIAYLGDRIGMKVGKGRLSLFGLRPKYSSIIVTIVSGVLIAVISLGLILLVSERSRVAMFELDNLLEEIEKSQVELKSLRQEKQELKGEIDNLAHNLRLFGTGYMAQLKHDIIYKNGEQVSSLVITSGSQKEISSQINKWLAEINQQGAELNFKELKYNSRAVDKLISIVATAHEEKLIRLIAANNVFAGDNLVVSFDIVGDNL
jgi:cell division protein FtsB